MVDVTIPQIGESINTVFVSRWLKHAGEPVRAGEPVLELDSDKDSMEVPSPAAGVVKETLYDEGTEVQIGTVVARIDESTSVPAAVPVPPPAPAPVAAPAPRTGPAARRRVQDARELPAPAASTDPRVERVPLAPLRRTIARRLVEVQNTAAILTTFNEIDMSRVMALRKQHQERFQSRHGTKLGFMSFFVKASIEALKEFPAVNAEIDGDEIVYKHFFHIGVAVSGPKGLVVPVVRDADRLSFAELEIAISHLATKAKENKLRIEDFEDGTFTLSNGGVFGSLMSTPILNPPQVGILGMHAIQERPVGIEGRIELRPMMYVALSYDHRIIDGREAVSFLVRVKECVESPERILLET